MITDPSGLKDMAYRVGNISYMPESMLAEVTNVPTPLKTGPVEPAQGEGEKEDFCMSICGEVEHKEVPTNSSEGQMRKVPAQAAAAGQRAGRSYPDQAAAWALCKRTGCPCDSWNGEHDEFCCLTCKSGGACKARYHVRGHAEPKKVRFALETCGELDQPESGGSSARKESDHPVMPHQMCAQAQGTRNRTNNSTKAQSSYELIDTSESKRTDYKRMTSQSQTEKSQVDSRRPEFPRI